MPITGEGWEIHIVRNEVQTRPSDNRKRTVGTYQVFHDGVPQTGEDMSGMTAEPLGPGNNEYPAGKGYRILAGRYPLGTQGGAKYKTYGYLPAIKDEFPKPGIEVRDTGERTEIIIHPGGDFLRSIGCINPCKSLPDHTETITFTSSRRRVISLIDDLRAYFGTDFPSGNEKPIANAHVVIDGEPSSD